VRAALSDLAKSVVPPPVTNTCFGANCPGIPSWSSPYFNAVVVSPAPPHAMRYVINTSATPDHVGGNLKLGAAANFRRAGGAAGFGGATRDLGTSATIVAHEGVLAAMSTPPDKTPPAPEAAWPVDTFFDEFH